jgi:glycyl-tRNA synthetase beta chain
VSLADKTDTLVGLFAAGEKPTGSRDPFGLRRAAQGVMKVLTDVPARVSVPELIAEAHRIYGSERPAVDGWERSLSDFLIERELHLLERRGYRPDECRAVLPHWTRPHAALRRIEALAPARRSKALETLAVLFKRVKNITRNFAEGFTDGDRPRLSEPAETALLQEMDARWPAVQAAVGEERFTDAMRELGAFSGPVDRFFVEVLVMADDPAVRHARLALLARLRSMILEIADIAEIAPESP